MRREHDRVLGEIVRSLADERAFATRSHLATHVRVPYDRLRECLRELRALGLVTGDDRPRLTERGRAFLRGYEAYLDVLARAGLAEPGTDRP